MITVIDEKTVLVEPGEPDANDVLEYAGLLIETEGWNRWIDTQKESSPEQGWSLHDSIGEANRRLFAPHERVGHGKDGVRLSVGGTTRDAATAKLLKVIRGVVRHRDLDDKTWENKNATSVEQVLAVLQKARKA